MDMFSMKHVRWTYLNISLLVNKLTSNRTRFPQMLYIETRRRRKRFVQLSTKKSIISIVGAFDDCASFAPPPLLLLSFSFFPYRFYLFSWLKITSVRCERITRNRAKNLMEFAFSSFSPRCPLFIYASFPFFWRLSVCEKRERGATRAHLFALLYFNTIFYRYFLPICIFIDDNAEGEKERKRN